MRSALAILLLLLLCALPAGAQASTLAIEGGISDNYKASYNANPAAPERRTWLSLDRLHAGGTTWRPGVPGAISFAQPLAVGAADGRSGSLELRVVQGEVSTATLRFDPDARWGPLVTVGDRTSIARTPPIIELRLTSSGTLVASGYAQYRAAAFAGSGSSIEAGGPGGRWHVGGVGLRTDWEPRVAAAVLAATHPAQVAAPPRITRLQLPLRTSTRTVPLRVHAAAASGRRVTHVRVRIDNGRYGRWIRLAPRYSVRLPRGSARRLVRVQVRDSAGAVSPPAARRVRCAC